MLTKNASGIPAPVRVDGRGVIAQSGAGASAINRRFSSAPGNELTKI